MIIIINMIIIIIINIIIIITIIPIIIIIIIMIINSLSQHLKSLVLFSPDISFLEVCESRVYSVA